METRNPLVMRISFDDLTPVASKGVVLAVLRPSEFGKAQSMVSNVGPPETQMVNKDEASEKDMVEKAARELMGGMGHLSLLVAMCVIFQRNFTSSPSKLSRR